MSELLSSLPGDIPGLLLRGSPVHWRDEQTPYVVAWVGPWPEADIEDGAIAQAAPSGYGLVCIEDVAGNFAIDLTDPTGRVHAAWWVAERVEKTAAGARGALTGAEFRAWTDATQGRSMTALAIDTLARLVLRLAGRE